jgi:hypothetical protein
MILWLFMMFVLFITCGGIGLGIGILITLFILAKLTKPE